MNAYREVWIRRMLDREARMVDMQIMQPLQNGTAFFASTTLLAVGGALALLRSHQRVMPIIEKAADRVQCLAGTLGDQMHRIAADLRLRLLQIRLVVPAVHYRRHSGSARCRRRRSATRPQAGAHVIRTTKLFRPRTALNRGQRAFFFGARLSRLVRQPLGPAGIHRRRGHRHLAPAIRLRTHGAMGS